VPVSGQEPAASHAKTWPNSRVNPTDIVNSDNRRWSGLTATSFHLYVPGHSQYLPQINPPDQNVHEQISQGEIPHGQNFLQPPFQVDHRYAYLKSASIHGDRTASQLVASLPTPFFKHILPGFLKPLPQRMTSADIDYLCAKARSPYLTSRCGMRCSEATSNSSTLTCPWSKSRS
jgi:hypothetical protein